MILRHKFVSIFFWNLSTWAASTAAFVIGLNSSRIAQVENPETRGKLTEIYVIVEVPHPEETEKNRTDTTPPRIEMPPQEEGVVEVLPEIKQPEEEKLEPEPPKGDEPMEKPTPELPETLDGRPNCGNGVLDEGEECDCGDRCPKDEDGNVVSCCDMRTCRWASIDAVCDHHDPLQPCCQSCHLAPPTTLCRPSKGECDPHEEFCTGTSPLCPPDKHTRNLTPCANGAFKCASGLCTSRDSWCQLSSGISLEALFGDSPSIISGYCPTRSEEPDGNSSGEEYSKAMQVGCRVECQIHYEVDRQWNEIESICIAASDTAVQFFPDGTDCTDDTFGAGSCLDGVCIRTASLPQPDPAPRSREPPSSPPSTPKTTILAATLTPLLALLLLLLLFRFLHRRRRRRQRTIHSGGSEQGDSQLDLIIESINAAQQQKLQARTEVGPAGGRRLRYVPSCERIEKMPTVWEVDSREGSEVGEKGEGEREAEREWERESGRERHPDRIDVIPRSGDPEKRGR